MRRLLNVIEDPKCLDITRATYGGPLVCGRGQYSCLGQHPAGLEMSEFLTAVLDRSPEARLSEPFIREATKYRLCLEGG